MTTLAPETMALDEMAKVFQGDHFAFDVAGCRLLEARRGYAVCEMELRDDVHYNAMHNDMGGAIFTLADYALAVACNVGEEPTVSVSNMIEYFSSCKGTKLIATAKVDKSGRSLGFYTVDVTDDTGRFIARMVATCKR